MLKRKNNGWITIEVIIAISLLTLLFTAIAVTIKTTARFNKIQLTTQQCLAAGRAQIDSIAATGKRIDTEDFRRLWPGLDVTIDQTPGTGDWQGLTLLEVTTSCKDSPKPVKVQLCRYLPNAQE